MSFTALNTFDPILKNRIFAEDLSQLFCRIHQKCEVLVFANKWVDLIDFGIIILNFDLSDEFHGI